MRSLSSLHLSFVFVSLSIAVAGCAGGGTDEGEDDGEGTGAAGGSSNDAGGSSESGGAQAAGHAGAAGSKAAGAGGASTGGKAGAAGSGAGAGGASAGASGTSGNGGTGGAGGTLAGAGMGGSAGASAGSAGHATGGAAGKGGSSGAGNGGSAGKSGGANGGASGSAGKGGASAGGSSVGGANAGGASAGGASAGGASVGGMAGTSGATGGMAGAGGMPCSPVNTITCNGTTENSCDANGVLTSTSCPAMCADGVGCVACTALNTTTCNGQVATTCDGNGMVTKTSCPVVCIDKVGCGACQPSTVTCDGTTLVDCDANGVATNTMCPNACDPTLGCVVCNPGVGSCSGSTTQTCKADGSGYTPGETCDGQLGLTCSNGFCLGACAPNLLARSYIGCEYWPTESSNGGLYKGPNGGLTGGFHFAISIGNTTSDPAMVTILQGATVVNTVSVPANSVVATDLPWIQELVNDYTQATTEAQYVTDLNAMKSAIVSSGAYHVKSTQPITVYQFNPLEYTLGSDAANPSCPDTNDVGTCNSYSNDASLLLPTNVLGETYLVASAPPLFQATNLGTKPTNLVTIPGLVAITATRDATHVTFKTAAYVRAGTMVNAMNPGDTQMFTLNTGDVVQLMVAPVPASAATAAAKPNCTNIPNQFGLPSTSYICPAPATYDLTGSIVTSDQPIAVLGGHDCAFMPFNEYACDHMESTMFPVETLGTDALVAAPQAAAHAANPHGEPDVEIVRVISAFDGNQVSFDPPSIAAAVTLNKGQYIEIPKPVAGTQDGGTSVDFHVIGTLGLQVVQYMLGASLTDPTASVVNSIGDPSMAAAVPTTQFRTSYAFLAPTSYEYNFVNVISLPTSTITLDNVVVTDPATAIGLSSGYVVRRLPLNKAGLDGNGAHTITGVDPFGILVHGYGAFTSYMYPGGLNLTVQLGPAAFGCPARNAGFSIDAAAIASELLVPRATASSRPPFGRSTDRSAGLAAARAWIRGRNCLSFFKVNLYSPHGILVHGVVSVMSALQNDVVLADFAASDARSVSDPAASARARNLELKLKPRRRAPGVSAVEHRAVFRAAVLSAAEEEFAQQGFRKTHVDDIAARAGMSPSLLYNLFAQKMDILKTLLDVRSREIAGAFEAQRGDPETFEGRLRSRLSRLSHVLSAHRAFYTFAAGAEAAPASSKRDGSLSEEGSIDRLRRKLRSEIERSVRDGMAEGALVRGDVTALTGELVEALREALDAALPVTSSDIAASVDGVVDAFLGLHAPAR